MNNAFLLVAEVVLTFGAAVLAHKTLGKYGLIAWIAVASVTANVMSAKTFDLFGMSVTDGTVMFASVFLATDILCEIYSAKDAQRSVIIGASSTIVFMCAAQIALLFTPSAYDYAHGAMETLFALNLRISISSVVMYAVANLADVYLFTKIKEATKGRHLWLRNNVATIVCNCGENFLFIIFAFLGIYSFSQCVEIALATSAIEAVVAAADTPFLYLAKR